jgi:hypothetical protein
MDLIPFVYIPQWRFRGTPRSRFQVVPLSGAMRLTSTCRSPLLKSFSIAVPANPKAHRSWPALLEPAAYVLTEGSVGTISETISRAWNPTSPAQSPSRFLSPQVVAAPYRSRRSRGFTAWVCRLGRGSCDTTTKQFYCREISIRFRPNRRASTDQAPGPSIASAAPKAPSRTCIQGSLACDRNRHSSATAISTPETGVHKPSSNGTAKQAATTSRMPLL